MFISESIVSLSEFGRLCQQWGACDWEWLNSFRADMSLYKGDHALFSQILSHECSRLNEAGKPKVHLHTLTPLAYYTFVFPGESITISLAVGEQLCHYRSHQGMQDVSV